MRVSLNWLEELVPLADLEPEEIASRLTDLGLEVDDIWRPARLLQGVVVARIASVAPHPEAERLSICTVDDGRARHQVVCGAPNARAGLLVPWAPPGVDIARGSVERQTIRGQESAGMLCSAKELGWDDVLGADQGLWELPGAPEVGSPLAPALGLDDVVLSLELTPNYAAHCQSILGVARELSAALGRPLTVPAAQLPVDAGSAAARGVTVTIEEPELCPRYTAVVLEGSTDAASPWDLQRRLLLLGVRPHNFVVDVTNYTMLERGQPLHAFDLDALEGACIVVRRARPGETITTLDGRRRDLSGSDLVIADAARPVAIAGVMGGLDSEVGPRTRAILLESASFLPATVRRTATRMGLRTDASGRFEKGLDPEGTVPAAVAAASMLSSGSGLAPAGAVIDVVARRHEPRVTSFRPSRARDLLGLDLPEQVMTDILSRLGCQLRGRGEELEVTIPSWRVDLELEVDLIEEVARHHGYDHIPSTMPVGPVNAAGINRDRRLLAMFRSALLGAGLDEAVTFSFMSQETLDKLGLPPDHRWRDLVTITNPQGIWQEGLRTTLLPGLLSCLGANHQNRLEDVWLFELGRVFWPTSLPLSELPQEPWRLAVAGGGRHLPVHWDVPDRQLDFFDLKGVLETLLARFGPAEHSWSRVDHPWLHPGRAAQLSSGERVLGWAGELHPEVAAAFGIGGRAVAAELDLQLWWQHCRELPRFSPWGRFPAATRDLAITVPEEVQARAVENCIREAGAPLLETVVLFDVYRGPQAGADRKSLAFSLSYRSQEQTLTDDDVDRVHGLIRDALQRELDAILRS